MIKKDRVEGWLLNVGGCSGGFCGTLGIPDWADQKSFGFKKKYEVLAKNNFSLKISFFPLHCD
jgi:hypothetical protein